MTSCWPSWKASDYADCGRHASTSQPLTPVSIRHNREVGMFLVMPPAALQGNGFDRSDEFHRQAGDGVHHESQLGLVSTVSAMLR